MSNTCLELFAGFSTISKEFEKLGYETYTIDWDERFDVDMHCDVSKLTLEDLPEKFRHPDVIFCGTPCETYSVAAISRHRRKNPITGSCDPISESAKFADDMNRHVIELIKEMNPKIYIFENPVDALRKMDFMQPVPYRNTTTYCSYGFTYRKATDFFSNVDLHLKPPCKNNAPCHEKAPRGARTGLQAIKDPALKAMYPPLLCKQIAEECDKAIKDHSYGPLFNKQN